MPLYGLASDGVYLAGACRQSRGALLPHLFTLTAPERGGLFSVALSLGSPPLAVNQHPDPVKPGLSSAGEWQASPPRSNHPALWIAAALCQSWPVQVKPAGHPSALFQCLAF